MDSAPRAPSALIIHAHPEPASFSTAQMRVAAAALEENGYVVEVADLYDSAWQAILGREEFAPFEGPFKPQAQQQRAFRDGALPVAVREHLEILLRADLLVLSFPLWWFSMPAVLKGWVDRVFVMGAVFGGDHGLFEHAALRGRRAVVLATTGGARESFEPGGGFGDIDAFLFHIQRGMLEFVGYEALPPLVTYGPAHLDDQQRTAALATVEHAVREIARAPSPSSRSQATG